ncbi:unnamed protein product [Pleuronectes platessa]|uniref:Uncharacterized protein n=1 Tax=Pleuronectes platessa TaxID=8262 RepID=A0A9N7YN63_PLEPL|nr:unnamed protein product [Pleuronectes platessa]
MTDYSPVAPLEGIPQLPAFVPSPLGITGETNVQSGRGDGGGVGELAEVTMGWQGSLDLPVDTQFGCHRGSPETRRESRCTKAARIKKGLATRREQMLVETGSEQGATPEDCAG